MQTKTVTVTLGDYLDARGEARGALAGADEIDRRARARQAIEKLVARALQGPAVTGGACLNWPWARGHCGPSLVGHAPTPGWVSRGRQWFWRGPVVPCAPRPWDWALPTPRWHLRACKPAKRLLLGRLCSTPPWVVWPDDGDGAACAV